jgi:hypothetical protein
MVVPLVAVSIVMVPVATRATVVAVMAPVATMSVVPLPGVVPLSFIVMALFPFPALPIALPVIVPVAIPARTNDNGSGRCDIYRRWSIDWLGGIQGTRDANVDADIDMREGDGRYTNTKAGDECHRKPAAT